MQIIDLERRLDDLEFRIAAHGFGEGYCGCVEPILVETVERLIGGRAGDEITAEINRCKSEVHNPRPESVAPVPFSQAEEDALLIGYLGGREGVEKAIAEMERLEAQPPAEFSPLVEKVPEPPPEPTLPDRIAAEILKPKKTAAEMLLLPENVAKEQALELGYGMGIERPEPDEPEAQKAPLATIKPVDDQETAADETKAKPVLAVHEKISESLRNLLERV